MDLRPPPPRVKAQLAVKGPVSLTIIGGYRVSIWLLGTIKK
jgi:hypothetical protein